jgi:hypothetical protein
VALQRLAHIHMPRRNRNNHAVSFREKARENNEAIGRL